MAPATKTKAATSTQARKFEVGVWYKAENGETEFRIIRDSACLGPSFLYGKVIQHRYVGEARSWVNAAIGLKGPKGWTNVSKLEKQDLLDLADSVANGCKWIQGYEIHHEADQISSALRQFSIVLPERAGTSNKMDFTPISLDELE